MVAVPALGTKHVQHAHTHKHMPRAHLAPHQDHSIAPVPALAWVWLHLGWGAQRGWGDQTPPWGS